MFWQSLRVCSRVEVQTFGYSQRYLEPKAIQMYDKYLTTMSDSENDMVPERKYKAFTLCLIYRVVGSTTHF